ncbi:MAG: hypothetical protein ACHQ51_06160 [Elusimicrobiota bacterium]
MMRLPLSAVMVHIFLAAHCAAQPSAPDFNSALRAARERSKQVFLTQEPGAPLLDAAVALPPAPQDPAFAAQREKLAKALADGREIQEGCARPCSSDIDVAVYLEKIRQASASLGMGEGDVQRAIEHYAPRRTPRLRAGTAAAAPTALDARTIQALMSREVSPRTRKAFEERATRMAAVLNETKGPETSGGAAIALGSGRLSPEGRERLLAEYRAAPAGDSQRLRTLKTKAPPPSAPAVEGLTRMERFALWVDAKVGSDNIQKASDFSSGFGDSMSFGATRWVRKKMGTNSYVNDGSDLYTGGTLSAVVVSLVIGGGGIFKPFNAGAQQVARWAPTAAADGTAVLKEGQFVMAGVERGAGGFWNWLKAGGPELTAKYGGRYMTSATTSVPGKLLRYPIAEEGRVFGFVKGLMGQRIYIGPTVGLL